MNSTTSDFILRAVPTISDEYQKEAEKLTMSFTGDPSFFAFNGEEEEAEQDDPDAPPVERFREVHRLAYTVKVMKISRLYISSQYGAIFNLPLYFVPLSPENRPRLRISPTWSTIGQHREKSNHKRDLSGS